MARASWFVTDTTVTRRVVKRRGAVWVQTHHGTPLKRMGLDLQEHPVGGAGLDFAAIPRLARRWDYVVSANAYSTEIWQRAYPGSGEVLDVGYPRNDRLATATPAGVARARSAVGVGNRTTVLYLPTFRDRRGDVGAPGPDPAAVAAAIPDEALLLVRAHYRAERRPAAIEWDDSRGHARIVDVSSYQPLEELYLAADILVTDYSSAMFDYAVLDRPMVIYAPDWEAYRANRGVYFDLLAHPPGVVARNDAELVDAFRSGAVWAEQARRKRATFRARFCALDDGHAAERVTRRVFLAPQARTDRYPRSRSPRSA
jgi:CDP-glycerol glycerophosphotransferase